MCPIHILMIKNTRAKIYSYKKYTLKKAKPIYYLVPISLSQNDIRVSRVSCWKSNKYTINKQTSLAMQKLLLIFPSFALPITHYFIQTLTH